MTKFGAIKQPTLCIIILNLLQIANTLHFPLILRPEAVYFMRLKLKEPESLLSNVNETLHLI